jgi:mannose-1-phosphate guanylyltransferase/mannose-6-phosphate isomerase
VLRPQPENVYNYTMFDYCLIMAGGSGTRLWPASNSKKPKQFLSIAKNEKRSFFSAAVERALALTRKPDGRVIIIAGESHLPHVLASSAGLDAAAKKRLVIIPEPEAKNTAPAVACALAFSSACGGSGGNMLVLTSDHIIRPLESFAANAAAAAGIAAQGTLVVFGIPPTRPETGYGYIETAGRQRGVPGAYAVAAFREKPDIAAAKLFCASKRFYWNSGMFAFSPAFMSAAFRNLAPGVSVPFEKLKAPDAGAWTVQKGITVLSAWKGLAAAYRAAEAISFDYAIAEKCASTVMIRADFDWLDVGDWEAYAGLLGDTGAEVYRAGERSCFVDSDIPVALAGVEDLIVVIRSGKDGSPPVALVTGKGRAQRVREIVEQIKKAGRTELL